jgi:predicted RNA-binding Zn ribbon-like protein
MNMSKSQAPRANAGGRVNFKVEQPASHKRAADRTVDGWDAADAIAEWSDLGALRPASSSQSWPADHRHFRRCGRVAKQPTRTSWGAR